MPRKIRNWSPSWATLSVRKASGSINELPAPGQAATRTHIVQLTGLFSRHRPPVKIREFPELWIGNGSLTARLKTLCHPQGNSRISVGIMRTRETVTGRAYACPSRLKDGSFKGRHEFSGGGAACEHGAEHLACFRKAGGKAEGSQTGGEESACRRRDFHRLAGDSRAHLCLFRHVEGATSSACH